MTVMTVRPAVRRPDTQRTRPVVGRSFYRNQPATNVIERDDSFELQLAVPGLSKEDITINLDENILRIEAANEKEGAAYTRKEFDYSNFTREFILPETIDPEKIDATCKEGVLRITMEKFEDKKKRGPQTIAVK